MKSDVGLNTCMHSLPVSVPITCNSTLSLQVQAGAGVHALIQPPGHWIPVSTRGPMALQVQAVIERHGMFCRDSTLDNCLSVLAFGHHHLHHLFPGLDHARLVWPPPGAAAYCRLQAPPPTVHSV